MKYPTPEDGHQSLKDKLKIIRECCVFLFGQFVSILKSEKASVCGVRMTPETDLYLLP